MKKAIRLTCPWCKKRHVIKCLDPYGYEIWECQNCGAMCCNLPLYIRKRIKYFFKKRK